MVGLRRAVALLAALGAALALVSCASFQRSRDGDAARRVTALVNAGQAERLAAMSAIPFLVDGEIVLLPDDVDSFWNGIAKAGLRAQASVPGQGSTVGPESYKDFADTMEVRVFFEKYVKKGARILTVNAIPGGDILLIVAPECLSWKIIGWKGPFRNE